MMILGFFKLPGETLRSAFEHSRALSASAVDKNEEAFLCYEIAKKPSAGCKKGVN
jgi:hypothetical protein